VGTSGTCSSGTVIFAAPPTPVATVILNSTSSVCASTSPGCQSLFYPLDGTIDVNDNFYVGNTEATNTNTGNVFSFSSNGYIQSISSDLTFSGSTAAYFANMFSLTADSTGYVYYVNAGSSSSRELGFVKQTNGIFSSSTDEQLPVIVNATTKPYAAAVDKAGNVWTFGINTTASANYLVKTTAGGASSSTIASTSMTTPNDGGQSAGGIYVDPNQNIWFTDATAVYVLPNIGSSASSPSYGTTLFTGTDAHGPTGIAFTASTPYVAGTSNTSYTPIVGQYNATAGVTPFSYTTGSPGTSGVGVNTITAGTQFTSASIIKGPTYMEADGIGNVWIADWKNNAVVNFSNLGTQTAYAYKPCLGGSTTCSSVFATSTASTSPASVSIDSTGSLWVPVPNPLSGAVSGSVVQIIGAAAPTWPLLSLGKQGIEP